MHCWRAKAECRINHGRHAERGLILERPRDNLHANRQPLRRCAHRNHCRRSRQRIEPLGVSHGIEVRDRRAFDHPGTLMW